MNDRYQLTEVYKSSISCAPKESIKRSLKRDMDALMCELLNEVDSYPIDERKWIKESLCEYMLSKAREISLLNNGGNES